MPDRGKPHLHPVTLELKRPASVVDAGAKFAILVVIETASGCDLSGAPFEVSGPREVQVAAGRLPQILRITTDSDEYDPRHGPVDLRPFVEIELQAPDEIGSFEWFLSVPEHIVENVRHAAASVQVAFSTRRHETSLAVWDSPTPVAKGSEFVLKVGAKCSAGCSLAGEEVEIVDPDGAVIARTVIGLEPWRGTEALFWTEGRVRAPVTTGHYRWAARMNAPRSAIPHTEPAPVFFSFVCVEPGEHLVRVELVDEAKGTPIEKANARLGPFRGATGTDGVLTFAVPGGEYKLSIWKDNHDIPTTQLMVAQDLNLKVLAKVLPEEDPYAFYWKSKPAKRNRS